MVNTPAQTPMELAIKQAELAGQAGEVPVGAVVVHKGSVIAAAGNRTLTDIDPTAHAEIVALRQAAHFLGSHRLSECDLHVTLEPCAMCAGAISHARIRRLYYGARDEKGGAVHSGVRFFDQASCLHKPEIYDGIHGRHSARMLSAFFASKRKG